MLKFSIITVSFNQGQYIRQNIESVLQQNYPNFEHIVIDGGSTDGTVEILKEYSHLNWVSEKDKGQSDGLNKGFKKATGDIIAWINSDDTLADGALHKLNRFFEDNPDKSVVTGNQVIIDGFGNIHHVIKAQAFTATHLLNGVRTSVMQNSTFFRRSVLLDVGYLDERFHYTMDHELFVRIAKKYVSYTINENLACFRIWEDSKTSTSQIRFFRELIEVKKKHHAKIFSKGNVWLLWQFVKAPFKRFAFLRNIVNHLRTR